MTETFQRSANKKHILVVEDDLDINRLVSMNLSDLGYRVTSCNTAADGYRHASEQNIDLIVLDRMLPDSDGLELCRQMRQQKKIIPIMMLTAKDSELDRVVGLEVGADDYLTKPFSIRELQARVKAQLRRIDMLMEQQHIDHDALEAGDLHIHLTQRRVTREQNTLELTQTEFDLLAFLAKQPGKVFNRSELLDQVWGYQHRGYEHTVNSHINRLRHKIEPNPAQPQFVHTVWGVGYKFLYRPNLSTK